MTVWRYARLYLEFVKQVLKVWLEYRVDFFIGALSTIVIQFASLLFVTVVFEHIQQLNGWSFYQILLIYGIAATGRSIHLIFFDNLWTLGWQYIRTGNFDRLLIRPINPLFHLIADRIQQDGVGQLAIGLVVLIVAATHDGTVWTPINLSLLVLLILSSGVIFSAVNLFFATLSFWMVDSLPVIFATFSLSDFARYPLTIYNKGIRVLLTWIIPYGFTAFYPAASILEPAKFGLMALITPLVAVICSVLAYLFWNVGLRAYTSTGN